VREREGEGERQREGGREYIHCRSLAIAIALEALTKPSSPNSICLRRSLAPALLPSLAWQSILRSQSWRTPPHLRHRSFRCRAFCCTLDDDGGDDDGGSGVLYVGGGGALNAQKGGEKKNSKHTHTQTHTKTDRQTNERTKERTHARTRFSPLPLSPAGQGASDASS
jgi:hypothetical protein